jgi:hypothetical protein
MRQGRCDGILLTIGDILNFWRVETFEPERRLRLVVEMKLPRRGWLEFEVTRDANGSTIRQTTFFDPAALHGLLYWYYLYLFHQFVFSGTRRGIGHAAEHMERQS